MTAQQPPETRQDEDGSDSSSTTEADLQVLRIKLLQLKQRRQLLQQTHDEIASQKHKLEDYCHELQHQQQLTLLDYKSWQKRRFEVDTTLKASERWNVLNDGFFIWHQGPFATINGIRLGSEAVVSAREGHPHQKVSAAAADVDTTATSTMGAALGAMGAAVTLPGRYLFSSSTASAVTEDDTASTTTATTTATSSTTQNGGTNGGKTTTESAPSPAPLPPPTDSTPTTMTIKVPWTEINSALGQIVLLLKILESTPHAGITFPRHVLVPQGSTSKIGLRQPNAITGHHHSKGDREIPIVALYHLYSDDSFQLFGKRNFNLALRALTECLATAAKCILARDRTIVLPFEIQVEHDNPSAPCLIGGLPVQFPQNDGIPWTRVMKYMLTNVKWCVAYAAKHVDR